MDIKEIVSKGVNSQPHMKWPTYDFAELNRADFVTASEVSKCLRQIYFDKVAAKNAFPPSGDTDNWGFFERGHTMEAWFVERFKVGLPDNVELLYAGDEQISFHQGDISGTPDGVLMVKDEATGNKTYQLLEIKSIDPRTNRKYLPKEAHVDQVQQNMHLVGECLSIIINSALVVYIDSSNYADIVTYKVAADVVAVDALITRAKRIKGAAEADDLPPEGMFNNGCKFCPHKERCSGAVAAKKVEVEAAKGHKETAKGLFK